MISLLLLFVREPRAAAAVLAFKGYGFLGMESLIAKAKLCRCEEGVLPDEAISA